MPTLDTAGGPLWYDTIDLVPPWEANPETVLFHHGVGIDHGIWCRWPPVLAGRFRLLLMDVRGYGRSARAARGHAWSMEGLAADVLAVADAAGAERFHFVGESLGGALGYHLAIHHGARLHSLTACTAPHRGGSVRGLPDWRGIVESRGMTAWSQMMMERRFAPGALGERQWRWFDGVQRACDPDVVLGQGDMLADVDLTDDLPRIAVPTLMIAGDRSPFLPPPVLADTHARVPGAALRLFDGPRHGVVLSHGAAAAGTMLDFLDSRT